MQAEVQGAVLWHHANCLFTGNLGDGPTGAGYVSGTSLSRQTITNAHGSHSRLCSGGNDKFELYLTRCQDTSSRF